MKQPRLRDPQGLSQSKRTRAERRAGEKSGTEKEMKAKETKALPLSSAWFGIAYGFACLASLLTAIVVMAAASIVSYLGRRGRSPYEDGSSYPALLFEVSFAFSLGRLSFLKSRPFVSIPPRTWWSGKPSRQYRRPNSTEHQPVVVPPRFIFLLRCLSDRLL